MESDVLDDKIVFMLSKRSFSPFRRLISRCLIAFMLLQFALPSWAAFGSASQPGWVEICAASGMQWVKLVQPDGKAADHQPAHDHCLLCASTGATPNFDPSTHLDTLLRDEIVTSSSHAAHCWYAGHSILSRAPPA